jgi:uncharacterized membrane protein YjjP (DUF1212 family)
MLQDFTIMSPVFWGGLLLFVILQNIKEPESHKRKFQLILAVFLTAVITGVAAMLETVHLVVTLHMELTAFKTLVVPGFFLYGAAEYSKKVVSAWRRWRSYENGNKPQLPHPETSE